MMNGKNVVLGITGGIAAYRAAQIAREMTKRGAHVYCILTRNATNFITQQTMETLTGNPAVVDMFARPDSGTHRARQTGRCVPCCTSERKFHRQGRIRRGG